VSLTPVRNLLPVSTTPAITENPWQGLLVGVNNKFITGVIDTREQLITSVIDTGDKHSFANVSVNFPKNSKWPNGILGGPGDNDS
jgi:hypothetical protein